jgi:tetratricopeptide (TPR) repeat protein
MYTITDSDFWKDKGNEYYKTGNYIEALNCFKRAIEINPDSYKSWYNLGMTYNRLGNKIDSRLCFDKSQEILSGNKNYPDISPGTAFTETVGIVELLNRTPSNKSRDDQDELIENARWHDLLYPGEWCVRFVIIGLLLSLVDNPVFSIMYYTCVIAALIALVFLLAGVVRFIRQQSSGKAVKSSRKQGGTGRLSLASSPMNIRTWIFFYLICFVGLLWAVFLHNQGMMLWVGFAIVIIVVGFNIIFIFRN